MIKTDKQYLRKTITERRRLIPETEAVAAGEAMALLLSAEAFWHEVNSVFCFLSVDGEPDTSPIINSALAEKKTVCVPRTSPNRVMEAVPIKDLCTEGWPLSFGIPEPPASYPAADAATLDLVIVPSLAVDRWGNRLGHGGGYYDNFIARFENVQKRPLFAAIQFAAFVQSEALPYEDYDMRVDMILTENKIIIPFSSMSI